MSKPLKKQAMSPMPTKFGEFEMVAFSTEEDERMPHIAMVGQPLNTDEPVLVRIHSECLTGDLFGSLRCDCREQFHTALRMVKEQGGVVLYMRQEGRGIGIIDKLRAYNHQDEGLDTVEANEAIGRKPDERNYAEAIEMLTALGITKVRLITNNPAKIKAIEDGGLEFVERVPISIPSNQTNERYMQTKKDFFGHF